MPAGGQDACSPQASGQKKRRCDIWSSVKTNVSNKPHAEPSRVDDIFQKEKKKQHTHLIDEKCGDKFSWPEHFNHPPDKIIVCGLGEVGFKTDIGEFWFRGDVNSPVCSLGGGGGEKDRKKTKVTS